MADERRLDERLQRQVLVRSVNDRIEEINEAFRFFTDRYVVLCECGRPACLERISVAPTDYRSVRGDERLFVVAPGHEQTELERVVLACPEYRVVALRPRARRLLAARASGRARGRGARG